MKTEEFISAFGAEHIKSRSNPRCVSYAKLRDKKYRDSCGLFLAEGVKLTEEALRYSRVECIMLSSSAAETNGDAVECAVAAREKGVHILLLEDEVFGKISTEKAPQGVISAVKYLDELHFSSDFELWQRDKRILMLCEIRDPGNLGTIIRTAEALGIDGVILSGCTDIYNSKAVRAAMGALFRLPLFITRDGVGCVGQMNSLGRRTIAAALREDGLILGKYETRQSDCVIIGNEGHGLPRGITDTAGYTVTIPMSGETESLNASSAASCVLWEYYRTI